MAGEGWRENMAGTRNGKGMAGEGWRERILAKSYRQLLLSVSDFFL